MKLVFALSNYGDQYFYNRHNIGKLFLLNTLKINPKKLFLLFLEVI